MTKREFIAELESRLVGLPRQDAADRVGFYGEMIDDLMEEGFSEADAIASLGSADQIAAEIIGSIPITKLAKERIKPRRQLAAWEITLLAVGAPVWFSLLIAAVAVVFSLYVSLWSVIISLWASLAATVGCALAGIVGGLILTFTQSVFSGLSLIGAGLLLGGFAILLAIGYKAATKGILNLTKTLSLTVKRLLIKKEDA